MGIFFGKNRGDKILVTGSNRSGSSWVGRVIGTHSKVDNIIEPLNLNRIERFKKFDINVWYLKVDKYCSNNMINEARKLFNYYLNISLIKVLLNPFQKYEGHSRFLSLKKRLRRSIKPIKMLKDPMSLFSIPWLVQEFDVKPIIIIRHPAAYVLSVKEKNWWFDFENLLVQDNFFRNELSHLKQEVIDFKKNEKDKSIIENAALFWKICYQQVSHYQGKYLDWFYIKHEELSIDPEESFKKMFDYLKIDFNSGVNDYIEKSTNANLESQYHRNSAENSVKWKEKLTDEEKQLIYNITCSVSDMFYDKFV